MSSGPSNLFDLAKSLLVAADSALVEVGINPPELQYVHGPGRPAVTCDELVVSWEGIFPGVPGDTATTRLIDRVMPRNARLQLWCFRCLADASGGEALQLTEAPDVAQVTYDAEAIMSDGYVLTRGVAAAHYSGEFKSFADGLSIAQCVPVEAAGGVGGCVLTIEAELS